jgi:hypothetical protein
MDCPPLAIPPKEEVLGILPFRGSLKQTRSRKVWGSCRLPGDGPDHPHLARNCSCSSPLTHYWVGTSGPALPWGSVGFKGTWKRKACSLSVCRLYLYPLCLLLPFPYLAEQVIPLFSWSHPTSPHPCALLGFFHLEHKPGSSDYRPAPLTVLGFMLARQVLYHLSHTPKALFSFGYFSERIFHFCLGLKQSYSLCLSYSWDDRCIPPSNLVVEMGGGSC